MVGGELGLGDDLFYDRATESTVATCNEDGAFGSCSHFVVWNCRLILLDNWQSSLSVNNDRIENKQDMDHLLPRKRRSKSRHACWLLVLLSTLCGTGT